MTTSAWTRVIEPPRHQYVVPGVYLVRAGDMSLDEIRKELAGCGLLFCRRFLAHAARSDYLAVFDPKILVDKCRPAEAITPSNSWAGRIKKEPEQPVVVSKTQTIVVAASPEKVGKCEGSVSVLPPIKKNRPGKRSRQMLKALIASAASEEVAVVPETIPVSSQPVAVLSSAPVHQTPLPQSPCKDKTIPEGVDLLVTGLGEAHPVLRLRPFRVSTTMEVNEEHTEASDMMTIPHLTVYHPPRSGPIPLVKTRITDARSLEYVDKCHNWIKKVLKTLQICGLLPREQACQTTLAQSDVSKLARTNLLSMQCRFQDDIPMQTRNAVYAVLRSAVWFQSLVDDKYTDEQQYLIRCWWRQVPVAAV